MCYCVAHSCCALSLLHLPLFSAPFLPTFLPTAALEAPQDGGFKIIFRKFR